MKFRQSPPARTLLVALACVIASGAQPLAVAARGFARKTAFYDIAIKYPHTGAPSVDRAIAAWVHRIAENTMESAPTVHDPHGPDSPWYLHLGYRLVRNDNCLFSVRFTGEEYGGGAHPNAVHWTLNFERPDNRQLRIQDLFDSNSTLTKVRALVIAELHRRNVARRRKGEQLLGLGSEASGTWSQFEDFQLTRSARTFFFFAGALASRMAGPQRVTISLSALAAVLVPRWAAQSCA